MRTTLRYLTPLLAAGGAAAAILAAPAGAAPGLPQCVQTGGGGAYSGSSTLCESPGNAQLNATPPVYAYPWSDEYYGPAMMIGGGSSANHCPTGGWSGGGWGIGVDDAGALA